MTLPLSRPVRSTIVAGTALVAAGSLMACAPSSSPVASLASTQGAPVLLSCPAGQQPLLRLAQVNGTLVPQVECVTAQAMTPAAGQPMPPIAQSVLAGYVPAYASQAPATYAPAYTPAPAPVYVQGPAVQRVSNRPAARRAVYEDDVVEYRRPSNRSWQKSAIIIGSSAGVGAGVGGAVKGKKGALIGAAIGGGAATIWDQVTRRK